MGLPCPQQGGQQHHGFNGSLKEGGSIGVLGCRAHNGVVNSIVASTGLSREQAAKESKEIGLFEAEGGGGEGLIVLI